MSTVTITGNVVGVGSPDYYVNFGKPYTHNPYLVVENTPYNPGDFPIAALEYTGFSPNKIISFIKRDEEIYENTTDYQIVETIYYNENSGLYPVYHYPYSNSYNYKLHYLVTEFNSAGQNGKPLFYQYEPLFDVYSSLSGIVNVNIYKNNETKLKPTEYKIQYSYDLLSQSNSRYSSTTWSTSRQVSAHRIRVLLPYEFYNKETFYTIEYNKIVNNISSYQKELIEIRPIYTINDFSITSSGLVIPPASTIQNTGTPLHIVKDPYKRLHALDLISIKGQDSYLTDKETQWKLRLNIGSFLEASGFYTGSTEKFYNMEDNYTSGEYIPLTNIVPRIIDSNILKVKEAPIYLNESIYTYPNYTVDLYDKESLLYTSPSGTWAIDVNGVTRSDIKISSIDRKKGFIALNKDIDPTDEIELSFYLDSSGWILIENLELNPKVNDSISSYHISGYRDGLGIAVKPWDGTSGTYYPYIYDSSVAEASRTAYALLPLGEEDTVGVSWTGADFFTICDLDLNRLSPDIVKLTDARRSAGGIDDFNQLDSWFVSLLGEHSKEKQWYADIGYYDGDALPHGSIVMIHLPVELIEIEKQKWINHYKGFLNNTDAEKKGLSEFNYYLDKVIRKYISAGTNYVLLPTSSGEFNGQIMELR
jgi:hypothetical protein